jgi:lipopolysaccharide export system permease protein
MLTQVWERYIFKELIKTLLFVTLSFYVLYVLVDYSMHSKSLSKILTTAPQFVKYYAYQFSKRADIILPMSILISTIRLLCTINVQNELVALLAGGIRRAALLRPFFVVAIVCTCLLYVNYEYYYPASMTHLEHFQKQKEKRPDMMHKSLLHVMRLADNTQLVYQRYDAFEKRLFDAYWIRSPDEFYHAKYLYPHMQIPVGEHVDLLTRNRKGELVVTESVPKMAFKKMSFSEESLFKTLAIAENLSLSDLWEQMPLYQRAMTDRDAEIHTYFYLKLAFPLLCFFTIIGPAPFCLRFGRHLPVFLIYTLSLFGFVAFLMMMDSVAILGQHHVVSPFWAVFAPLGLFLAILCRPFFRLERA